MAATNIRSAATDPSSPYCTLAAPTKLEVVAEATGVVTVRTELIVVSEVGTGMEVAGVDPAGEALVDGTGPVGVVVSVYWKGGVTEAAGKHVLLPPYCPAQAPGDVEALALEDVTAPVPVLGGIEVGAVLLEPADAEVEGLDEDSGTDAEEVAGRVVQEVVLGPVGTVGAVAGVVVSTELIKDDGEGTGDTGELLTLPVGDGLLLVDMTWVVETVVLDVISVVQGEVLGAGVLTRVGIMLLSHEISLPNWRPGVARAGPMAARRRTVDIVAMILGILNTTLSCGEKGGRVDADGQIEANGLQKRRDEQTKVVTVGNRQKGHGY